MGADEENAAPGFSPRERELLRLLADGLVISQIARRLVLQREDVASGRRPSVDAAFRCITR